jgi:hypothetical protein
VDEAPRALEERAVEVLPLVVVTEPRELIAKPAEHVG